MCKYCEQLKSNEYAEINIGIKDMVNLTWDYVEVLNIFKIYKDKFIIDSVYKGHPYIGEGHGRKTNQRLVCYNIRYCPFCGQKLEDIESVYKNEK